MTDLTDEEIEDYEEQLEDTSIKALLWEQNALLRGLYDQLAQADPDETDTYRCKTCGEIVEDREQHLRQSHKLPPGADINYSDYFEPV